MIRNRNFRLLACNSYLYFDQINTPFCRQQAYYVGQTNARPLLWYVAILSATERISNGFPTQTGLFYYVFNSHLTTVGSVSWQWRNRNFRIRSATIQEEEVWNFTAVQRIGWQSLSHWKFRLTQIVSKGKRLFSTVDTCAFFLPSDKGSQRLFSA